MAKVKSCSVQRGRLEESGKGSHFETMLREIVPNAVSQETRIGGGGGQDPEGQGHEKAESRCPVTPGQQRLGILLSRQGKYVNIYTGQQRSRLQGQWIEQGTLNCPHDSPGRAPY